MINITRGDAAWLLKLLLTIEGIHESCPELFTSEEEETLKITAEIIRSIT